MFKSFTFNGIKKEWVIMGKGRRKAPFAPVNRNLLYVPGMDGAHLSSSNTSPMIINQPIIFKTEDDNNALQLKDELAEWLVTDESVPLEFDDEPGRIYFALVQNTLDDFEKISKIRRGTIQFLVLDGYSYGPEKTLTFPSDMVAVENEGTAEADPIFELTVKEPVTFAMIQNHDEEYQMIGRPADDDVEVVDTKTSVLYENGSTLDEWTHTENRDMVNNDTNISNMGGTMTTDDARIRVQSYGLSGSGQRGPAIYRELDTAIQDFEMETTFDIISNREIENFRMMIYFNDENMNPIGQIGLKDNTRNYKRRRPIVALGRHLRGKQLLGDNSYTIDNSRDNTLYYLRFKREGKLINVYVGYWRNQRHQTVWQESFRDVNDLYQGKLKYITLFIGSYQDRVTPSRLGINSVEVFELSQVVEDQTPYIARVGDIITFDHINDDLLINGENRTDIKDFGGQYFKLKKGVNELIVRPEDAFDVSVKYRDKFR